ncbi:hypothetical protein [Vibrio bivalvicida]|uniref:Uncharacterized protein n=1 Tax=Vibrio bivalvicida TaxID=1276888 RepID=A0A177Y2V9_9VIBR|nr:hypothetical protein [Vibrio bivalvicida]OAJ95219.1 hypothetical protein APB76_08020 [Vibrio bivalvicida]
MTAEVAIYNRSAITLAADSAVSISRGQAPHKIYNNAEKLFAITKHHPVGLMIYGSSDILGIPWELIVKQHRVKLGETPFPTLKKYAESFFTFTEEFFKKLPFEAIEGEYNDYLEFIIGDTFDKIIDFAGLSRPDEAVTADEIHNFHEAVDELTHNFNSTSDFYDGFDGDDLVPAQNDCKDLAVALFNKFFNLDETADQEPLKSFIELCALRITKLDMFYDDTTGLVFAGYGEDEYLPQMYNFDVYGVYEGKLKYYDKKPDGISAKATAGLQAFAQREEVDTFMQGASRRIREHFNKKALELYQGSLDVVDELIEQAYPEAEQAEHKANYHNKITNTYSDIAESTVSFVKDNYVMKVVDMIKHLPKNEMAYMAESLINLTAFKRKVSNDSDTVGGPIDVAVISKGDGFVWVKRKYYFDGGLNQHYGPKK